MAAVMLEGGATLSPDRIYRYELVRRAGQPDAGPAGVVNFVALNPSTADEQTDDPTVRRLVYFARAWNYAHLRLTNLFAFRATDPRQLMAHTVDVVGPENNQHLAWAAEQASMVVVCWGALGHWMLRARAQHVLEILGEAAPQLFCFGLTAGGHPRHPLYLPRTAGLIPFPNQAWRP